MTYKQRTLDYLAATPTYGVTSKCLTNKLAFPPATAKRTLTLLHKQGALRAAGHTTDHNGQRALRIFTSLKRG